MGNMCYRCMKPTVTNGVCPRCGEPELGPAGNGDNALAPGAQLGHGRLTVGKKLGSGGFGVTYIAFDNKIGRRVCLKEFMPNYLATRQGVTITPKSGQEAAYNKAMNSFLKEARALYELRAHPNIVHVISTFKENNTAYYTMEMLEGESFLNYLRRKKKIGANRAFQMLLPIMSAIQYVHTKKMIHRDISPDNIMLCEEEGRPGKVVPKLIDFGAAHVAIEGFSLSYPGVKKNGFSPLEQNWEGNYQGPWTDVYAFCATFYSAITGGVPTAATDRAEADRDPMKPPIDMGADITQEMSDVLMHGLKLKYQERIQTMDQLIRDMTNAVNSGAVSTQVEYQPPTPATQPKRPVARRVFAWIVEMLLMGTASYFVGVKTVLDGLNSRSPDIAKLLTAEPLMTYGVPVGFLLLDIILIMAAGGTLGHCLFGLKMQKEDEGGKPGFGSAFLYSLFYTFLSLVGLICGFIWLASGKDIGPLEKMAGCTITRRGEMPSGVHNAAVISEAVNQSVFASRPEAPVPKPKEKLDDTLRPNYANEPAAAPAAPVKSKHVEAPRPKSAEPARPASAEHKPHPQARPQASDATARPSSGNAAPQSAPPAALICRRATDTASAIMGQTVSLKHGITLGKNRERAAIVVPDQTVSGLHCSFHFVPGRGWYVKDEKSTNGTFVNDIKLPSGGSAPLRNGTALKVGKEIFEFRCS